MAVDRVDLMVPLAELHEWERLMQADPLWASASSVWGHDPTRAKVSVWGIGAERLLGYWADHPRRDEYRITRVDVAVDQPEDYIEEGELVTLYQLLREQYGRRLTIGHEYHPKEGDKGSEQLNVGSYKSESSFTVYQRGGLWRIEARFRGDSAREAAVYLLDGPRDHRLDVLLIHGVQVRMLGNVIFQVGDSGFTKIQPSHHGATRRRTPAEQIAQAGQRIMTLAEKHSLWRQAGLTLRETMTAYYKFAPVSEWPPTDWPLPSKTE